MAQAYTPGLTVTESITLRKERRLPMPGRVLVAAGQTVSATDVVAATELPGNVTTVNVARELNVGPEEMPGLMLKAEGDAVQAGEPIAEYSALWGIFHSVCRSPAAGTVENISAVTGQVLIRGAPLPVELTAYVDGTVVEILGEEGVVVECHGALLQGILGVGGEAHGQIKLVVEHPAESLEAEQVTEDCEGQVLVGGAAVSYEAVQQVVSVRATGLVVGGIDAAVLDKLLGEPLGVAITGHENIGLTLMITEGFGEMPMAQRAFELLQAREGQPASLNGATQIRAGVIRPELIIPDPHAEAVPAQPPQMELRVGSSVRLIRDPYFGLLGTVTALPVELQTIETESRVRVVRVRLADGRELTVPRANIELIAQ